MSFGAPMNPTSKPTSSKKPCYLARRLRGKGEKVLDLQTTRLTHTLFSKPGIVPILASMGAIQVEVEMAGVRAHVGVMLWLSWP